MATGTGETVAEVRVGEQADDTVALHVAVVVVQAPGTDLALQAGQPCLVLAIGAFGVLDELAVSRQRDGEAGKVDLTEAFHQVEFVGGVAQRAQGCRGLVVVVAVDAATNGNLDGIRRVELGTQLGRIQLCVVLELHAVAVDVVLQVVVADAAEHFGRAEVGLVGGGHTFRVDVAVPDDVAHAHPWLHHLAADQVQVRHGGRVPVEVGQVDPQRFLLEVVVQALVGRAGVGAAAGGHTHTGVDLRVDLAVEADTGTYALTVLVTTAGDRVVDVDVFVAQAHVTLDLGLGGPCHFLFKGAHTFGLSFLVGLFLGFFCQVALQFVVLRLVDRAIGAEHFEQLGVDSSTGRGAQSQHHAGEAHSGKCRNKTHKVLPTEKNGGGSSACPCVGMSSERA